jgi:alpha-D-ribose 1-methylphosphonate 5-triphosphate synthase subunit PhnG
MNEAMATGTGPSGPDRSNNYQGAQAVMEREQLNFFLQQVGVAGLSPLCAVIEAEAEVEVLQKPTAQTLLVPVHDPINGGSFIGGEVLVTSAIVQVNGTAGWAMVMDDNPLLATSVAMLDAAFAAGIRIDAIVILALRGKEGHEQKKDERNYRVKGTKVAFDLL